MIDLGKYVGHHSPGYVAEVYHGGECEEVVLGEGVVWPARKKCDADTLYDIASLTKVYTAVLVYMACEEGRFEVEDYVGDVDDRFSGLKGVRIVDLLSHNQEVWTEGYLGDARGREEFYRILFSAKVKNKLPTYVDAHYIILSAILERIYGMGFGRLLEEKIFRKLGLTRTTVDPVGNNIASSGCEGLDDAGIGLVHDKKGRVARGFGITTGHASIFTTGGELLTFLKGFLDNTLLAAETISKMLEHDDQRYNYMGVRYRNDDLPGSCSDNAVTFSGYTGPAFLIDFDKEIIIVVMCNVLCNAKMGRLERKRCTDKIINEIYEQMVS